MGAYDPQGREIIASLARVMRASRNVSFRRAAQGEVHGRSGAAAWATIWRFSSSPKAIWRRLQQSKVKKIVSICPHCVRTIGTDWKEYGEAPPIEHHSEFMARHLDQLPARTAPGQKIVYHDPCYLGRYRNVYDEPRDVLARSGTVIDPPRSRERSFCCGAGGGLAFLGEEKGERVSVERAEELVATGRERGRRGLPVLQYDVSRCAAGVSETPPKLLDIAQIAAAGLPRPNQAFSATSLGLGPFRQEATPAFDSVLRMMAVGSNVEEVLPD